jgi:hypothetical protein
VALINPSTEYQCPLQKDAKLSVNCPVNPALVPLYARVGPGIELHSKNVQTSRWLKSQLLSNIWVEEEELEGRQLMQCPVGLLINVEYTKNGPLLGCDVTDLLVYGTLSTTRTPKHPPSISSLDYRKQEDQQNGIRRELRIYAMLLSESLITKVRNLPSPPPSPASDAAGCNTEFAEFIPDLWLPSAKRKRISTLFEVAAQHHKRVRQRGGEAVSQLMANTNSQAAPHLPFSKIKKESEDPSKNTLERIGWHRSQSLSLGGSLPHSKRPGTYMESLKSTTAKSQIPNATHRLSTPNLLSESQNPLVAQCPVPLVIERGIDSSAGEEHTQRIMSENKALITRTVLTCMRLYGFHRNATRSASVNKHATAVNSAELDGLNEDSIARTFNAEGVSSSAGSDEDEFKTMYHAMYKASTFALRKYLKKSHSENESSGSSPPVLNKEKAMNIVDELLRLFCEDN